MVQELVPDLDEPDIYFPRGASDAAYLRAARDICLPSDKMYAKVFPNYGNIVSASIPAGMDMALKEGRLKCGHGVVMCPASRGDCLQCCPLRVLSRGNFQSRQRKPVRLQTRPSSRSSLSRNRNWATTRSAFRSMISPSTKTTLSLGRREYRSKDRSPRYVCSMTVGQDRCPFHS